MFLKTSISILVMSLSVALAQTGPAIESAYGTEITVDGRADPAAAPIVIVDTSYPAETSLGRGPVSREGKFAIVVKPSLIEGHRLVAVDRSGRRSAPFIVAARRSGPVPPRQPR